MEIPEDTKMFLRAVLVSSPGMQQSRVMKEYQQTTGEPIQFSKYGYKNIYEFLIALEGEVTRLEFCPKFGENLVYSVLDKTKYFSKHAAKYANKVRTGMKSKSPAEVLLWRKDNKSTLPPVIVKRSGRNRNNNHRHQSNQNQNQNQVKRGTTNIQHQQKKEVAPTVSEWVALRKLLPESGVFNLCIRNIGVNQTNVKFEHKALHVHFSPYNAISSSIRDAYVNCNNVSYISFPSFFTAYRAWKEKDKTIIMGYRIGVEPAGGNMKDLSTGKHMIFVINIPEGLLMSTFVTRFAKFPGLLCIDPRPREHCALISYSTPESAKRACTEVTSVSINGKKQPITVQLLEERPSMSFGAVNSNLLKSIDNKYVGSTDQVQPPKLETVPDDISSAHEQPRGPSMSDNLCVTSVDNETKENTGSYKEGACGFSVSYRHFFQMFQITCRKTPNTLENVPNEIQFLVTHQFEPIRFWGWLMSDNKDSVKKLSKIEETIASTVLKIQPPHVLPKEGHRGAALYKEEEKETWYRCYVLSSNPENDEVEVFYCDYGNSEVIPKVLFRSTYNDVWSLPPQAVPFKMYGFELKDPHNLKSTDRLNIENGQVLQATVVKTSSYSQPHIIEIKDVRYVSMNSSSIDEKILGVWSIPVGGIYGDNNIGDGGEKVDVGNEICDDTEHRECNGMQGSIGKSDSECIVSCLEKKHVMESIFDYDDEDLVLGLLAEAHSPNLLYLKLGDVSQFAKLQIAIDDADLALPKNLDKGDTLLLNANGQRRRVLTLQVLQGFGKVKVLHVDYGVIEWVAITDLYHIQHDLRDSPFQARPAALAGIDCNEKMEEVVAYLKGKVRIVIKTNVIHQSSSGKISVELFDLQTNKSINKELIDNGLASCIVNEFIDTDEELSPNMIPLPVKELGTHIPQKGLLSLPGQSVSNDIDAYLNALWLGEACMEAVNSDVAWNSQPCDTFQGDGNYNNELPIYSDVPKLVEVCTWLEKSPLKGEMCHNTEQNDEIVSGLDKRDIIGSFGSEDYITNDLTNQKELIDKDQAGSNVEQEAVSKINVVEDQTTSNLGDNNILSGNHEMESVIANGVVNAIVDGNISYGNFFEGDQAIREEEDTSYPPPDIIASNKINDIQIDQGISIDGRKIRIGDDNEVLSVDKNNKLDPKQVDEIRQKWIMERARLVQTKEKLEHCLNMSIDDLTDYYKRMKKEKLQLKLRIKQAQKYSNKLESEYDIYIQETNQILSLI